GSCAPCPQPSARATAAATSELRVRKVLPVIEFLPTRRSSRARGFSCRPEGGSRCLRRARVHAAVGCSALDQLATATQRVIPLAGALLQRGAGLMDPSGRERPETLAPGTLALHQAGAGEDAEVLGHRLAADARPGGERRHGERALDREAANEGEPCRI